MIGPKFHFLGDGEELKFRHVPIQNSLSALISVPTWWKSAWLNITTCWISPDKIKWHTSRNGGSVCENGSRITKETHIRLPGTVNEIKRKLGYKIGQVPHIETDPSSDPSFKMSDSLKNFLGTFWVGQKKADLLIQGGDLWRSTVVTVGAQRAETIEVLPNMKGIIATFDEIKPPVSRNRRISRNRRTDTKNTECYTDVDIVVWTSEGRTMEPRQARIYKGEEEHGNGKCKSNGSIDD